jgi:predicted aldo/keto reductase-like oxidoreductase
MPARAKRTPTAPVPTRPLGRTGADVSIIGIGGYHLGIVGTEAEAIRIIHEAIDAGVTLMDNAWEYHEGESEKRMGKALAKGKRERVFLMTKLCTHGRDAKTAMKQLEESLRRLRTDYLDLWQIHEVAYYNDPERHFMTGGAADALLAAKAQGKVRCIGFTGHKDPELHLKMLSYDFPFDTCQLPLNCFDATFKSFEQIVLPELVTRGIAPLGMKSFGGEATMLKKKVVTPEEALRYAMSLPVASTISGIDSRRVLQQNLEIARDFKRMSSVEMDTLRLRVAAEAADGRFELYKVSAKHEGPEGRKQHGFPDEEEMAA